MLNAERFAFWLPRSSRSRKPVARALNKHHLRARSRLFSFHQKLLSDFSVGVTSSIDMCEQKMVFS